METDILQLQVRSCGTAFQQNCDKLTLAFIDLSATKVGGRPTEGYF